MGKTLRHATVGQGWKAGHYSRFFQENSNKTGNWIKRDLHKGLRLPAILNTNGGGRGIRTHGGRKASPVFKTGAFNRSASPPKLRILALLECFRQHWPCFSRHEYSFAIATFDTLR